MYSEQLEQLIKSVIADGVVTEKERAVLHKKAAAEGVDEDEIDVYVEGLIAQKGQISEQKNEKIQEHKKSYDLSVFQKVNTTNLEYYKLSKVYLREIDKSLGASAIQFIFFDVSNHIEKKYNGLGLLFSVSGAKWKYWTDRRSELIFYSNGKQLLKLNYIENFINPAWFENYFQNESVGKYTNNIFCTAYHIDEEILKPLCDASNITLIVDAYNSNSLQIKEIPLPYFQFYAQYCYHHIVDNSAYLDAESKLDELISDERNQNKKEVDADDETLKVLTIPKKVMNKVALGHKYFDQFAVKNSNIQLVEFDEKYSLSGVNSCIKVFSILKEEKTTFFLKVVYDYYVVKKNRKGEEEREKKVMYLNRGSMNIICDGYTEVKLSPLAKSKEIYEKDSEMNFYPISEQDMRKILAAENISISLYGSKLKSENIRHIGLSTSLPFVWKQAFATLMGEEVPEKKTLFGKLKGLFK